MWKDLYKNCLKFLFHFDKNGNKNIIGTENLEIYSSNLILHSERRDREDKNNFGFKLTMFKCLIILDPKLFHFSFSLNKSIVNMQYYISFRYNIVI